MLADHADVSESCGSQPYRCREFHQLGLQRVDGGPSSRRLELQGTPEYLFKCRCDYVGRIEANRTCLFAPAFTVKPLAGYTSIKQGANRENIGALVYLFAPINLRRRIAVIKNRLALQ